jgi:hypothetical protein
MKKNNLTLTVNRLPAGLALVGCQDQEENRIWSNYKTKYNEEITNPEETNKEIKKTLDNYKNNGNNIWMNFKTVFYNAVDNLGNSINTLLLKLGLSSMNFYEEN